MPNKKVAIVLPFWQKKCGFGSGIAFFCIFAELKIVIFPNNVMNFYN